MIKLAHKKYIQHANLQNFNHYNNTGRYTSRRQDDDIKKEAKRMALQKFNDAIIKIINNNEQNDDFLDQIKQTNITRTFDNIYTGVKTFGKASSIFEKTIFMLFFSSFFQLAATKPTAYEWSKLISDNALNTIPKEVQYRLFSGVNSIKSDSEANFIFNELKKRKIIYNPAFRGALGIDCPPTQITVGDSFSGISALGIRHEAMHITQMEKYGCDEILSQNPELDESSAHLEHNYEAIISEISTENIYKIWKDIHGISSDDANKDIPDKRADVTSKVSSYINKIKLYRDIKRLKKAEFAPVFLESLPSSFLNYAIETKNGEKLESLRKEVLDTEQKYWSSVGSDPQPPLVSSASSKHSSFISTISRHLSNIACNRL